MSKLTSQECLALADVLGDTPMTVIPAARFTPSRTKIGFHRSRSAYLRHPQRVGVFAWVFPQVERRETQHIWILSQRIVHLIDRGCHQACMFLLHIHIEPETERAPQNRQRLWTHIP